MYNKEQRTGDRGFLLSYILVMNVRGRAETIVIYIRPIGGLQGA